MRLERLDQRMLVGDLVTLPEVTPLIRAARGKGCITTTGVEMHTVSLEIMCAFFFDGH